MGLGIVLIEVAILLVVAIALLWSVARVLGHVASRLEKDALVSAVLADLASTWHDLRRPRAPARPRRREPTAG